VGAKFGIFMGTCFSNTVHGNDGSWNNGARRGAGVKSYLIGGGVGKRESPLWGNGSTFPSRRDVVIHTPRAVPIFRTYRGDDSYHRHDSKSDIICQLYSGGLPPNLIICRQRECASLRNGKSKSRKVDSTVARGRLHRLMRT
jgi:hypothetical protein